MKVEEEIGKKNRGKIKGTLEARVRATWYYLEEGKKRRLRMKSKHKR